MTIVARCGSLMAFMAVVSAPGWAQDAAKPFVGRWALDLPNTGAGWLGVNLDNGFLDGSLLWYGGSVNPLDSLYMDGTTLMATRSREVERKDASGKLILKQRFTETFSFTVSGDVLTGVQINPRNDGSGVDKNEFTGKRIPPLPAKPDLSKVKFGKAITLFNGKDLTGWKLTNPGSVNGWRAENSVLINDPVQKEGQPHINYGNLRTEQEFEDFNLKLEVNVPPNGNSGIYLRGIYEVQVVDSFGKPLDPHNMGGIYSRITPLVAAEKPAGEWQTFDITLCDRYVTVTLNGKTIIDNEPLLGCTGGALWSDEFRPGPLYLQGDHTGVQYRNIVLKPIAK
ncbi:MAG TPA: DUF1080 domain-containing protein [Candidatus Hydrogenedentes bacterium]|nr:DUF1080 domain-containing protein [Candidatus Hydrogenedentota bacterium]